MGTDRSSRRRSSGPLAVALAVVVLASPGCGSDTATVGSDPSTSSVEELTGPDLPPSEPSTTAAATERRCSTTTSPAWSIDGYSGSTETLPPLDGEALQVSTPPYLTDADVGFSFDQSILSSSVIGDLDGDGLDEVQVLSGEPAESRYYLVPGSTPPGVHELDEVGIRLDVGVAMAPDRDGDAVRELVEFAPDRTRVLSGATVLAGTTDQPLFEVAGELRGFVSLGDEPPMVLTGELADDESGPIVLHLADEERDLQFTTAPEPFVINYTSAVGTPSLHRTDQGIFLDLAQTERAAARAYRWLLDPTCL